MTEGAPTKVPFYTEHLEIKLKKPLAQLLDPAEKIGETSVKIPQARSGVGRESSLFFGINLLVLGFSIGVISLAEYPLHFKHHVFAMNVANILSIGLGTLFRFWAYKRFVFLHPDKVHSHHVDLDVELAE